MVEFIGFLFIAHVLGVLLRPVYVKYLPKLFGK